MLLYYIEWLGLFDVYFYIFYFYSFFLSSYFIQHLNSVTSSIILNYASQIKKMARHKPSFIYHTLEESIYLCDKSYNL